MSVHAKTNALKPEAARVQWKKGPNSIATKQMMMKALHGTV